MCLTFQMITPMNNSMFVGDYFKLRFQILQLIVDVLFLIWSMDEKWTSLGPLFYLFLSFGKFMSSALIVSAAKGNTLEISVPF